MAEEKLVHVDEAALRSLVEAYQRREQQLKNQLLETRRLLSLERMSKLAIESQLMQVKDEVEGLLKGGLAVTKQATMLVLYLDEKYNGIMNAAKHLRKSKIPWTTLALAAFGSVAAGGAAYVLSEPANMSLLVSWLSVWTNQLFIAVTAVVSLGVVAVLMRRRRRVEAV